MAISNKFKKILYGITFLILFTNVNAQISLNNSICEKDTVGIYSIVEEEAKYPGGNSKILDSMSKYLNDFEYSEPLSELGIYMYIDSVGYYTLITLNGKKEKDLSISEKKYWDAFNQLSKWTPAKCNGRNVSSYLKFIFYINYK